MSVEFVINPYAVAPSTAEALPLTNPRRANEPPQPIRGIVDANAGAYSEIEKGWIQEYWALLYLGGVLTRLDQLCMPLRGAAESAINWVPDGIAPTITGATFTPGVGFVCDGVDDFINTNVNPTVGSKYALNDGLLAIQMLSDGLVAGGYAMASDAGSPVATVRPKSSGTNLSFNINAAAGSVAYAGPFTGLWLAQRTANNSQILYRDGAQLLSSSGASTAVPTGNFVIGKQNANFHAVKARSWAVGKSLSAEQRALYQQVLADCTARFGS